MPFLNFDLESRSGILVYLSHGSLVKKELSYKTLCSISVNIDDEISNSLVTIKKSRVMKYVVFFLNFYIQSSMHWKFCSGKSKTANLLSMLKVMCDSYYLCIPHNLLNIC
jgi:hypothetical protein